MEESYWHQRSLTAWLLEGDRNTRYFHWKVAIRHTQNTILLLEKDDGEIISHLEGKQNSLRFSSINTSKMADKNPTTNWFP